MTRFAWLLFGLCVLTWCAIVALQKATGIEIQLLDLNNMPISAAVSAIAVVGVIVAINEGLQRKKK